jgi:hypothetical protein
MESLLIPAVGKEDAHLYIAVPEQLAVLVQYELEVLLL